jgi:acetolactate synthase-1/2/3 large subunit
MGSSTRSGGRLLADQLVLHGTELAFCVPGESYLPLLDALHDQRHRLRLVTCRHEGAAANAAEAVGKLTGRPGVCLVTRGPGATHAATGVHTARQDSTPLLLLVGQVATGARGRDAFQELDYGQVFGSMAKWAAEVDDPERIPELVARAFATAMRGRPGPVVLALPEDVLAATAHAPDARPHRPIEPVPGPSALTELRDRLSAARRPVLLVGGGPWDAGAAAGLTAWASASELPVAAAFRRQDVVDNESRCYAGQVGPGMDPALARRFAEADLLLAIGPRLSEIETQGYAVPGPPVPDQTLVHVHPDAVELGRVYQADLPILAGVRPFAAALAELGPVDGSRWAAWARAARADHELHRRPGPPPGRGVDLAAAVVHLSEALGEDAIVANGAGNSSLWVHRFHRYRRPGDQLAPQSGAMGYSLPAALAAALVHPGRPVVAVCGDGDLQMCAQELATAVQERLPVLVLVVSNGLYGTIRMHQERRYPGRPVATSLGNPDFAALARAHGAYGERVERTAEVPAAVARARAAGGPALLELVTDPGTLTPP